MRAAVLAMAAACAPADAPHLDSIDPARGPRGAVVTLAGRDLCAGTTVTATGACEPLPAGAVDFGLAPPIARAVVVSWTDMAIAVRVPMQVAVGATTVYVTVDGRSSNGLAFEVTP